MPNTLHITKQFLYTFSCHDNLWFQFIIITYFTDEEAEGQRDGVGGPDPMSSESYLLPQIPQFLVIYILNSNCFITTVPWFSLLSLDVT